MKILKQLLVVGGAAIILGFCPSKALAQRGGGNFDPAQMRQQMMDRYKEAMEVKSDDEWKIISERIGKVMDAQRDARSGRGGFAAFGRQRGGNNATPTAGADQTNNTNRRQRGGNNNGGGNTPTDQTNPEAEALQKAIEAKAPSDEIKAKLAAYRASRKDKESKLEKAQDDLRKVLTMRQEAMAVLAGLLT